MAGFASYLLFVAGLMTGLGVIVFTLVDRWDAILAALAGEQIPHRAQVVSRHVVRMRPKARTYRPVPSRQQIRRAAA
ncbi:hypothetical protein [Sphingomonas colocasiae]|uniref:Uncharacterized protein n=1 Tax=Sphingomonas colocasiae TaxID=1848973 RepID=A0ABS7PJB5_9SPHN|nr:hypothetical protein [Sphingomonas colocasiae]MBY8821358.1 hypothetical protein [Sphingomonas colocasiae]